MYSDADAANETGNMRDNGREEVPGAPGSLSPELERRLLAHAKRRLLSKGQELFAQKSAPDAIYYVDRGKVRLSARGPDGKESAISVVGSGVWFGEMSLFIGARRINSAYAMQDTELFIVSSTDFHEVVDGDPAFLVEFARLISTRYRLALDWLEESILLPLPVRFARFLLDVQHTQLARASAEGEVSLCLSQKDLSHRLGVSRQTVSRQLKDWEQLGILRLEYGRIILVDPVAVAREASDARADETIAMKPTYGTVV